MRFLISLVAVAATLAALIWGALFANAVARVGAGYKAKITCSEVFIAGRDFSDVLDTEFTQIDPLLNRIGVKVDADRRVVTASLYSLGQSRAVYREGYGCTLRRDGSIVPLPPLTPIQSSETNKALAGEQDAVASVNYSALSELLSGAIANEAATTRAIAVYVDGDLVGEAYAEGFDGETPMLSWSMAKSVTSTLVGAAVLRGIINLDDPAPVVLWADNDPRNKITWRHLLQMESGLDFEEDYADPRSDVNRMLFDARDMGAIAAERPLAHAPGTNFYYSSGTSNLVQRSLRHALDNARIDYHLFVRDALFEPLGAASAVFETDATGTFVGSSYLYASTYDWAKLAQLYLDNGELGARRLLPDNWATFISTPTAASDNGYGGHFWLNAPGAAHRTQYFPGLPYDAYMMAGHEGQYAIIIPDKRMLILRFGRARNAEPAVMLAPLFAAIYEAVAPTPEGDG